MQYLMLDTVNVERLAWLNFCRIKPNEEGKTFTVYYA